MPGTITITNTTYLKPSPTDSGLDRTGMFAVSAGQVLRVVDVTEVSGHYKILLETPIANQKEWFVFKGHCKYRPTSQKLEPSTEVKLDDSLASRIVRRMQALNLKVFVGEGELNIVYLEGVNLDGTLNNDILDEWNDLRVVLRVVDGVPEIVDKWIATSEVGAYYTFNPMNRAGAARIQLDSQFKAWRVGMHGSRPYESLVQVAPVSVCRDLNKDGKRTGDKVHTGLYGVNQHHGFNAPRVGRNSAGCLVGKSIVGHQQFMKLVKTDVRYQQDSGYVFWTAVLDGSKL
jgi:hypothetical protein